MSSRPALVFVVYQPPIGALHGSGIRTNRLLHGLAETFDLTLVTYVGPGLDGPDDATELQALLPGIDVVGVPLRLGDKRVAQLRSLPSRRSWQFGRFARPELAEAVRGAVARTGARIVHYEDLGTGQTGPVPGTLSVFAPHNIEHRIIRATAETNGGVRGTFAALDWRRVRDEEVRVWRAMPLCLGVSPLDAATMREGGAPWVEVAPNGTDPSARLPLPPLGTEDPLRLLFVGTASYQPYERGLAWFVREVLPRMKTSVALDVVGDPPLRPVEAPGVTYHGRVPSVEPFYAAAHAVIVPVFEGSGTRLKIVEALALGRPVVSTALGAEGLPVEAGVHYDHAETPEDFAAALERVGDAMTTDPAAVERRLAAGHASAAALFWPAIVEDLAARYRDWLEAHPA